MFIYKKVRLLPKFFCTICRTAPGGKHFLLHRARFYGIFVADGIFKFPSAALLRENRARRKPFYISIGRDKYHFLILRVIRLQFFGAPGTDCRLRRLLKECLW